MYIVCYTIRQKKENLLPEEYEFHSDWKAYETLQEAEAVYNNLLNREDLYTASICKTVKSTDYFEDPADKDDRLYHEEQDHIAMEKAKVDQKIHNHPLGIGFAHKDKETK